MANKEHVNILKQGADVWNRWRQENPGVRPDLSFVNLVAADLSRANLSRATLQEVNLAGARYSDLTQWPEDFDPCQAGAIDEY